MAIYYVAASGGSDSNPGTSAQPWATFAKAWTVMARGDTLRLKNGTYFQQLRPTASGGGSSPITVEAENDGQATIDGQFVQVPGIAIAGFTVFQGLIFRNGTDVVVRFDAADCTMRRCSIYDADPDLNSMAVLVFQDRVLIEDCVVSGTFRKGINLFLGSWVGRSTVRRCFVQYERWDGRDFCGIEWPSGNGIENYSGGNATFENNVVYSTYSDYGIGFKAQDPDTVASNNWLLGNMVLRGGYYPDGSLVTWGNRPDLACGNWTINPETVYSWRVGCWIDRSVGTIQNTIVQDNLFWGNASVGVAVIGSGTFSGNTFVRNTVQGNGQAGDALIAADATQADLNEFSTISANKIGVVSGGAAHNGEGCRIRYRYVDGVYTGTPLWPWPMEARVQAELGLSVTDLIGAIEPAQVYGSSVSASASPSPTPSPSPSPTPGISPYPLEIHASGRYLVTQQGTPFLMLACSPQGILVTHSAADMETWFAARAAQGFNTIQVHVLCGTTFGGRADRTTYDGIAPFSTPGDFATPNAAYFNRLDALLAAAAVHGLCVQLSAAEYIDSGALYVSNGNTKCYNFGVYLGNRYKDVPNLFWSIGNDWQVWNSDATSRAAFLNVVDGIRSVDANHFHTAWLDYYTSASRDSTDCDTRIALDFVYDQFNTYNTCLVEYALAPAKPLILGEAYYEADPLSEGYLGFPVTAFHSRKFNYWSLLSGACGTTYEYSNLYAGPADWQAKLTSAGATQIGYLKALWETYSWWLLVPDAAHTTLTAGYGTFGSGSFGSFATNDYATCARASDGSVVLAYLPTSRTVTIDLTKITAGSARARWFNPATGAYTAIGTFVTVGTQTFTPASQGLGEAILVLDALAGSVSVSASPSPSPSPSASPSRSPSPSITASPSPSVTKSASPSASPSPSAGLGIANLMVPATAVQYEKHEITFDLTGITATQWHWPYDAAPPAGVAAATGITVRAVYTQPSAETWEVPGFWKQDIWAAVKGGRDWHLPLDSGKWTIRFSPHVVGNWTVVVHVQDAGGTVASASIPVTVSAGSGKGFVRVNPTDTRYFRYDDGSHFAPLGYEIIEHLDDPTTAGAPDLTAIGAAGVRLVRGWLSAMFGSAWLTWIGARNQYGGYLPRAGIMPHTADGVTVMTLRADYTASGGGDVGWFDATYGTFWDDPTAVKQATNYRVTITYRGVGITGPRAGGSFGLIVRFHSSFVGNSHDVGAAGTIVVGYGGTTAGWTTLTGTWNSGGNDYLPKVMLSLYNVNEGEAYIREVSIREDLGGGNYGPEILEESSMSYEQTISEEKAFSLDEIVTLAETHDVKLKWVLGDKDDVVWDKIEDNGDWVIAGPDNTDGFHGTGRTVNKTRWLQQTWWRYCQARWGYSTAIHSWELTNEGDLTTAHYEHADEFAKYLKSRVFGVSVSNAAGAIATLQHPNRHLVTTSFYAGYADTAFWENAATPNSDYADIHAYISTTWANATQGAQMEDDAAYYHYWHSFFPGATKPVLRGEGGMDSYTQQSETVLGIGQDTTGVWLKTFLWSCLDEGALGEIYWWRSHLYDVGYDHRPLFGVVADFLEAQQLQTGGFVVWGGSTGSPSLQVYGQKNIGLRRVHLWVRHINYTWRNVVDGVPITPITSTVTVPGFPAGFPLRVRYYDPWTGTQTSTTTLTTTGGGDAVIPITALAADVTVTLESDQPSLSPTPSPSPSASPSATASPSPSVTKSPSLSATPSPSPSRSPSITPSASPSATPSPSVSPSRSPSVSPSPSPSRSPSPSPSRSASVSATPSPSRSPSPSPSVSPSPSLSPSASASPSPSPSTLLAGYRSLLGLWVGGTANLPEVSPSPSPSLSPSVSPSASPSVSPSPSPSVSPSASPSLSPSVSPSPSPSLSPSLSPSPSPSVSPSVSPSPSPSESASPSVTESPSPSVTPSPSESASPSPSPSPSASESASPSPSPSASESPSPSPSLSPSPSPSPSASLSPTASPSLSPSPSPSPSRSPSPSPSRSPSPSPSPSLSPSVSATLSPSASPSASVSPSPSVSPPSPSPSPSASPTGSPTPSPSESPTRSPTPSPSPSVTASPSPSPSASPSPTPSESVGAPCTVRWWTVSLTFSTLIPRRGAL